MPIVDCPMPAHESTCICGGSGKINASPAVQKSCATCGDPAQGYLAVGNVTLDEDSGKYIAAACPDCGAIGVQRLVDKLNADRSKVHPVCSDCGDPNDGMKPLGHFSLQGGRFYPKACPLCGTSASPEIIAQLNGT